MTQATATIVERKGVYRVKVVNKDRTVVWAERDQNGRIRFDHPEHVPRHIKHGVVQQLFKEIDSRKFGIPKE